MRFRDLVPWKRDSGQIAPGTTPVRSDPFALLQQQMNRLFDDPWSTWFGEQGQQGFAPAIDLSEDDTSLTVRAEIPGMTAEDIALDLRDGHLTISGEKKDEQESSADGRRWRESRWGRFSRTVALPVEVDEERCTAAYSNGVLTVVMPKVVPRKPTRIAVASG